MTCKSSQVCLSVCLQWFTGFCVIMGAWTCCTAHILQNILLLCFKTLGMMFFLFSLLWYSYFHAILHLIHCVFTSRLCKPCFLHVLPCIIQVHSNTAATLGPLIPMFLCFKNVLCLCLLISSCTALIRSSAHNLLITCCSCILYMMKGFLYYSITHMHNNSQRQTISKGKTLIISCSSKGHCSQVLQLKHTARLHNSS